MRIAVCFSGQMRTGFHCIPNVKNFLGVLLPYCDFFIHTWNINKQKCYNLNNELNNQKQIINNSDLQNFVRNYKPKKIQIDDYDEIFENEKTETGINIFNILQPMWYSYKKSIELKKQYESENNVKYDFVVKLRPDILFKENRKLSQDLEFIKKDSNIFIENFPLNWDEDTKTVDDVYFVSNSSNMEKISCYYDEFIKRGLEFGSWSFIKHLNSNGIEPIDMIDYKKINRYFDYSVLRPECIHLINDFEECDACENYYYGNPNDVPKNKNGYYITNMKKHI
jgi:hypothetical protein